MGDQNIEINIYNVPKGDKKRQKELRKIRKLIRRSKLNYDIQVKNN